MSKKSLKKRGTYKVILHDDNHNTFENVIDSIMNVCGYNYLQAVQCTIIVHEAKRCNIYEDRHDDCQEVAWLLRKEGLTVTVEKC
jgi:ATP-dependent Clp protease adaptor protein ClpS